MRRLPWLATALVLFGCIAVQAQITVFDPAITIRNTTTAIVKELLGNLQEQQRRQIRRMSRRLSLFTDLQKYKLPEPPRWRIALCARYWHLLLAVWIALYAARNSG